MRYPRPLPFLKFSLLCPVQARLALHRGTSRRRGGSSAALRSCGPRLTYALPHLAIQFRIELIRVHLGLSDLAGARTLMREVDELLQRRPKMGVLVDQASELRARLSRQRGPGDAGASTLTAAELRLLPLLTTHLSFPEIAAGLFVSPNTAKTHAVSIYRKLGASTRTQAVTRARELGLLEG
jgi:LuxR family maltose regulon positive regulatory protein